MKKLYVRPPFDEWALQDEILKTFPEILEDLPTPEKLIEIQKSHSVDHATMALMVSIRRGAKFSKFVEEIDEQEFSTTAAPSDVQFVLVPAMFYSDYPEVGAGGEHIAEIARRTGFKVDRLETGSKAGVVDNAKVLKKWISEQTAPRLGIISMSKGSLEFRYAWNFLLTSEEKSKIKVWLNLGGFPVGNSLANHYLSSFKGRCKAQLILWASGLSREALVETASHFEAWKTPWALPSTVKVMNFVPIPLSSHVQSSLVGRYLALSKYGPNDGMTDCRGAIYLPGEVYPVWGADHYCRTPEIIPVLYRMFSYVKDRFESF